MLVLAVSSTFAEYKAPGTREELNKRLAEAIATTIERRVVLEDILGEGKGAWDAEPRYPAATVNCIVWLQLLLAEVYGKGLTDKTPVMDKIRYFGGQVGFSTRKHYTDHWLSIEPQPFKRVDVSACGEKARHSVDLDFKTFLKSNKFSCPLYKMEASHLEFDYIKRDSLSDCARKLPAGYYVLFAVPTEKFLARSMKQTGPMGLVHAMVLRLREHDATKGPRSLESTLVYHASTAASQVQVEPLSQYLGKSKKIHRGYVVYELDPAWDYTKPVSLDAHALELLSCEKALEGSR